MPGTPPGSRHLAALREAGVHLVDDPAAHPLPEPGASLTAPELPWAAVLDALDRVTGG